MQKQNLKFFAVLFAILIINVPLIDAAKQKKGRTTTRATPAATQSQPTQAPNQDAAKLSYGNQGPPPAYQPAGGHPPPYSQNPPPSYQSQQPAYHQPAPAQQPVNVYHVQQPQQSSGGGLGIAGGLAVGMCHLSPCSLSRQIYLLVYFNAYFSGALAGAAGGYAISKALEGDEKKEETTTTVATTTVAGATTTIAPTTLAPSSSVAHTESVTPTVYVISISTNETTTFSSNMTANETTTIGSSSSSVEPTTLTPVNEALIEPKNSTTAHQAPANDGIVAKISLNVALLSLIYHIIF